MSFFEESLMDDIDSVDQEGENEEELFGEYDEDETGLTEEQRDELEDAGLDPMELWNMDEEDRFEAIEDAGLDPEQYVFAEKEE